VVDQLRTDYLDILLARFEADGFRRLADQGVFMRNISLGLESANRTSATAVIYTGAYPNANGIPSSKVYNTATGTGRSIFLDPQQLGNYTTETLSPAALSLSTLSDELMIDGAGLGAVYAISAYAPEALIMAGHAGTNAAWLNTDKGQWATTTYYRNVPQPLQNANIGNRSIAHRADTMRWKPLHNIETYKGIPSHKKQYPFLHTFGKNNSDRYDRIAASPVGNREITDLAIEYIDQLQLGRRGDAMDMLNIGYTLAPYKQVKDGDYRLELQDAYIRLDADLGRLFRAIDRTVGLHNSLIFLTSTGYYNDAVQDADIYRIPSGNFSVKRALSLLNSFLVAKYGNGNYISGHQDRQIYLNHELLKQKNLEVSAVAEECEDFMLRMSGVAKVYTAVELLSPVTVETELVGRGISAHSAGDLMYRVSPGWNLIDDFILPITTTPVRYGAMLHPAFVMAPGLQPHIISEKVEAVRLAPSLSALLKIRTPNGATHTPLAW